jgi:hypothetical protein
MGESKDTTKILAGKPERERSSGKYGRRLQDKVKIELRRKVCEDVDWIRVAQDRGRYLRLYTADIEGNEAIL